MRGPSSARRQGLRKKDAQVSLFPFLAVLICTMGALIVLLVVLVQQARVHAENVASTLREKAIQATHLEEEQRLEIETHEWRLQLLQNQREEIARRLAGERLRLSHVEDHYRRLLADLQAMRDEAAELERIQQGNAQNAQAAQAELARIQQLIVTAREQLAAAQSQTAEEPQSFALIPYEGPNGTRRRPIYIECLGDRIVLQPEGVTLNDRDFQGPLGPGNPLDAALRAAREYLARTGGVERHGEPYPLMVVRSQGARAYAAARAAIESWDQEFGYELVDDDLKLSFSAPDPALKETMETAINEARRRQEILRASQPNRFEGEAIAGFQATSRHGGFRAIGDAGQTGGGKEGGSGGSRGEWESVLPGGSDGAGGEQLAQGQEGRGESSSGETGSAVGATSRQRSGGVQGGADAVGATQEFASNRSFAAARGRDWGLKDATQGATPYTRPITVQCFSDRLVLAPERGTDQQPVVIPLQGATRTAIDPFVQAIWKRMDRWGLAGNRAYWKPVLRVEVAPDAERRFEDLQKLLDESGLVIERKTR
jgi:hypothetical protein